jgi:hypothetical protein
MLGSLVVQRADMTARPDPKAGAERLRFIEIRPYSLALVPFIAAVAAAGISQGATALSDEDRSATGCSANTFWGRPCRRT